MPDFVLQENPEVSPKSCYFCETHDGPFVNTMRYDNAGRIILICSPKSRGNRHSGCAGGIAREAGCLTPKASAELKSELAAANAARDQAEARLEGLRDSIVEAANV